MRLPAEAGASIPLRASSQPWGGSCSSWGAPAAPSLLQPVCRLSPSPIFQLQPARAPLTQLNITKPIAAPTPT